MRPLAAALIAVSTLLALPVGLPAKRRPSCRVANTRAIASSHRAEIREGKAPAEEAEYNIPYYGCVRSVGRPHRIFDGIVSSHTTEYAERARVAGTSGALSIHRVDEVGGECSSRVVVFDLRTGHRLRGASAQDPGDPTPIPPACDRSVAKLLLTKAGGAAWATAPAGEPDVEIRRDDGRGQATLDRGAIDPSSLQLHAHTLSWVNGGVRKQARLR